MKISQEEFEIIVEKALDDLPGKFQEKIHNVAFFVKDFPSKEQMGKLDKKNEYELLGIFEGYGQSKKLNFGAVLPDRITLFRIPICNSASTKEGVKNRIISTLKHEIAHHFGSDEKGAKKSENT